MAGIIVSSVTSLPRDIDVTVNISKPQVEVTTDFSTLGFITKNAPFGFDASRVRVYRSLSSVLSDFDTSSEVYKAATAFFSQSPRSSKFLVGKVFNTAQSGYLQCGPITSTLEELQEITTGGFGISANGGEVVQITGINFSAITAISGIVTVLNTALTSASVPAVVSFDSDTSSLRFTSSTTGEGSTVSFLTSPTSSSATDISSVLKGNQIVAEVQYAYTVPGYSPLDGDGNWLLGDELQYVQLAASNLGTFVYAWTCEAEFRDTDYQIEIANWVEAQTYGIFGLVTNSPLAKSASSTSDVGSVVFRNGLRRTFSVYHNNPYYYPEVSILAYALSVNYSMQNSTITTKFKKLQGIPTVPLTESELGVLTAKRINTYTLVGNTARTFREGVEADASWYIDDLLNLDNFREELQASVYNVFLRSKKVPYNADGVSLIYTAIQTICEKYVYNGTFSERPLSEVEAEEKGFENDPPYTIDITPIGNMTIADRAARIGPPAYIRVNLAGAIHSIDISVEAYN